MGQRGNKGTEGKRERDKGVNRGTKGRQRDRGKERETEWERKRNKGKERGIWGEKWTRGREKEGESAD